MKKIIAFFITLFCASFYTQAQATNNAIKMGYNFVTVSQTVVFDANMQSGGTLTLSAQVMDGGGRNPGDPFTLKLVFYNSSNAVVSTVQQAYTMVLGGALAPYSITATNCGGSCTNVAYVSVQFYGKDGGFWAGNYGPYIIDPSLTFNGGSNILYNPEFGVYGTNGYAQGWTSSNGWQSCALYSGAQTCVVNNGATVNGGNYSATGGTTSSTPGGYTTQPVDPNTTVTGTSVGITAQQTTTKNNAQTRRDSYWGNNIYIDQVGDNNNISISQASANNTLRGYTQQDAQFNGSNNTVDIRQGAQGVNGKNLIELDYNGGLNNIKVYQDRVDDGSADTIASGNHVARINVNGNSNTLFARQRNNTNPEGHVVDINITGNSNNVSSLQMNDVGKSAFINIQGDSNVVNFTQDGQAAYYADIKLRGNGHNVSLHQTGQANHKATIDLTNSGASATVSVTQQGTTAQSYSLQQTCVALPCGATITQGQR